MKTWLTRISAALPLPVVIILPALVISTVSVLLTGWFTIHYTRTTTLQLADDLLTSRLYHINDNLGSYIRDAETDSQIYAIVRHELLHHSRINEEHLRRQFHSRMEMYPHLDVIGATLLTADGADLLVQQRGSTGLTDLDIHYTSGSTHTLITAIPVDGSSYTTTVIESKILTEYLARLEQLSRPRWMLRDNLQSVGSSSMLSYVQPIRDDDGTLLGAMHTAIYLERISQFLSTIRSSRHEDLLIVDHKGRIVAASNPTYQRDTFISLDDPSEPYLHPLKAGLERGDLFAAAESEQPPFRFEVAGTGYLARAIRCSICDSLDWTIVAMIPEQALIGGVQRSVMSIMHLLFGSLIAAMGAGIITTLWIIRPLRSLSRAAQQVAGGNWGYPLSPQITHRHDAIGDLARSFEHMSTAVRHSFKMASERQRELVAMIEHQQQTETRLRESQSLLQGVLDYAPLAITVFDPNGTYLLASTYTLSLIKRSREELIGNRISDVLPSHLSTESYAEMQQIIETGKPVFGEFVLPVDGVPNTFWYATFPLFDNAGNVLAFGEIASNITERIEMERALRESEQRFRQTLEHAPIPVFIAGRDVILFANAAATALLGYTQQELLAMSPTSLLVPTQREDLHFYIAQLQEVFATGHAEFQVIDAQGQPHLLEVHTTALPYDTDLVGLSMAIDITASRATEAALRSAYVSLQQLNIQLTHSRDTLRTLLDGLDEAVMMLSSDGTIINLNQHMAKLFGQPVTVLVGQQWGATWQGTEFGSTLHTLIDATYTTSKAQSIQQGCTLYQQHPRIYKIETLPVIGESNETRNIIVKIGDITEQVEMRANASRIEAFAASGVLAASVAHEINTPLQTVMNALTFLPTATGQDQALLLEAARSEIKRAGKIVRQFLDLYRPRNDTTIDTVDCNAIIERLLLLLGRRIKEQGITLHTSLQPDLPVVPGYPDQITQVFLNLLMNALDATPNSGSLTVVTGLGHHKHTGYVEISISDTGSGISAELLPHIFEPFTTTKPNGTGLGLAISQRIVQQHHGTIYVNSQVNSGTTFTVVLPVVAPSPIPEEYHPYETASTDPTR